MATFHIANRIPSSMCSSVSLSVFRSFKIKLKRAQTAKNKNGREAPK